MKLSKQSNLFAIGANMKPERIFITPLAKRIAKNNDFDYSDLQGSGPHSRIIKADVIAALEQKPVPKIEQQKSVVSSSENTEKLYDGSKYEKIDLTNVRKTIAERLTQSKQTIPHFYLRKKVNVDALLKLRKEINETAVKKISINDFIIKAVALSLRDNPDANIVWNGDSILKFEQVDISVAVSSENGLVTPVIRNCENLTLSTISKNVKEFAEQANNGKLHPKDYTGGSFSISNLGMFGIDSFDAIINPPQSGILAVGGLQKQIVMNEGLVSEETFIELSAAFDHRAIDGVLGANLMSSVTTFLENPITILV